MMFKKSIVFLMVGLVALLSFVQNVDARGRGNFVAIRQVRVARVNVASVRFNRVRIAPVVAVQRVRRVQGVVIQPVQKVVVQRVQKVVAPHVAQRVITQPFYGYGHHNDVVQQVVVPERVTRIVEVPNLVERIQIQQDACGNVQRVQKIIVNGQNGY